MIIIFVLHIIHKYKSVTMKINCHFENFHVHIKIYMNIKTNKNHFDQWYTMFYFITVIFVRKRKSYVKIISCKHE